LVFTALAVTIATGPAFAQGGDAVHGKQIYEARCTMCHAGGQGPNLAGVVGCKAASAPGYPYSAALKAAHIVWTPANLDAFLAGPTRKVPGTSMFVALPAPADRKAVIAYLASVKR
jgi:cytochrome c2